MLSPTRQAIADELQLKIDQTEGLLAVLQEFHSLVVDIRTIDELHAGLYSIFKMNVISDEKMKDWMKFLERNVGAELMDREGE
jgi:uncharacterized protein YpbB